jgi:hypothetical protein
MALQSVWISLAAISLAYNASADSASIFVPLQRTGVDRNAGGQVSIRLGETNSFMTLQASNLTAGRSYAVVIGGVAQGSFVADARGRGAVRFARPSQTGAAPFDFDPRRKQCLVMENGRIVLRAMISGPGEPRGSVVSERMTLPRKTGTGRAVADFELLADGTRRFAVTLTNVANGRFAVYVNGVRRGNIVARGGSGAIQYDNDAGTSARSLNYDPRGFVIDILQDNVLRFSGEFTSRADGISVANPAVITHLIPPTSVTPDAVALARRWVDRDARREFDLELFNAPEGIYELYVEGVFRGFMPVLAGATGTFGEMQFSSDPDDEDEQLLDFEPFTSFYTVLGLDGVIIESQPLRGGVVISNLISGVDVGLMPSEIELPLFNLGVVNGAGRVQLKIDDVGRRHFEVELRNVPSGEYVLTVNELPFGTINVLSGRNGTRGLIEFEDEPELDEFLLTWNPLDQKIGIVKDDRVCFDRRLPAIP